MKKPGNFDEQIHKREYRSKYTSEQITAQNQIYDHNRKRELLDGLWNHHVDIYDTCLRGEWFKEIRKDQDGFRIPWDYDFDLWDTIRVPSVWNTEKPEYFYYEGSMIYTRKFLFEKGENERVMLKVGAAYHNAMVFLNKEYLGYHEGGDTPFYMEITGNVQEENRILIVVNNTRAPERIPSVITDWYNYGGLYRSVELYRLPEAFIKDFRICLKPNSNFEKIEVSFSLDGTSAPENALLEIPELNIHQLIPVDNGKGELNIESSLELWSPENPKLYDVYLTAGEDRIHEKTGFREIRREGTNIILNGNPVKLRGVSVHEESVSNGKAVTEDEIRENFRLIKELNGNFSRLAHYPHTEKAARIADEMGLLLWEEIPVYWAIHFENPKTLANGRQQLTELIKRDWNRPSVILWSVGNENPDTDERLQFMGALVDLARKLDPNRLISAACIIDHIEMKINDRLAEKLDVIGMNEYFGWYKPDFKQLEQFFTDSHPKKPVIITEFGAGAKSGHHGSRDEMFTEEYQRRTYENQTACFGKFPFIAGCSPWILFDFRTPIRCNNFQGGYNRKGLFSEDKKYRKLACSTLKEFYASWR